MNLSRKPGVTAYSNGFSLLELMIVLAVIAVLLTIAVPSYQQYVQRANRAEVIREMLEVADCQSRIKANNGFYDTSRCLDGLSNTRYDVLLEPLDNTTATEFTVIAAPKGNNDQQCGNLSLDHTGTQAISGGEEFLERCWSGR